MAGAEVDAMLVTMEPRRNKELGLVDRAMRLVSFVLVALSSACKGDDHVDPAPWEVTSPGGELTLCVAHCDLPASPEGSSEASVAADGEALCYRVEREGLEVLGWSPLGIVYDDEAFTTDLRCVGIERGQEEQRYTALAGKRRERSYRFNELFLELENTAGARIELHARAGDEGVAFRYHRPGTGEGRVERELSGFNVPAGADAWIQPGDKPGPMWPAYERYYQRLTAGDDDSEDPLSILNDGWNFPALFRLPDGATYAMITESDLDSGYCASRLEQEVIGTLYRLRFPSADEGDPANPMEPASSLPWSTPWRVIIVGDLGRVVQSTIVDDLSRGREATLQQVEEWARPGRVAWSWWSQDTGDPALQRRYVDFAAELGWEYVLVDAGWDRWTEPYKAVEELVAYAAERGVGILLWYNSGGPHNKVLNATPRDLMHEPATRRAELARVSALGVKGIKVDFFLSDKQQRIVQYIEILQDAAEQQLMVNFHGATLPRGWQRRFPHLMTMEAVRGAEMYRGLVGPAALDNVRDALIRNVVGSMDYTPVTFEAAQDKQQMTYAHQLALSVVFESGWQHFADRADDQPGEGYRKVFGAFPEVAELMREVCAAWDETRLLDGDPDSHAVLARRCGDRWFIGGLNGRDSGELGLKISLSFLEERSYEMSLLRSAEQPDEFVSTRSTVSAGSELELSLLPRDGFVAHLAPSG